MTVPKDAKKKTPVETPQKVHTVQAAMSGLEIRTCMNLVLDKWVPPFLHRIEWPQEKTK